VLETTVPFFVTVDHVDNSSAANYTVSASTLCKLFVQILNNCCETPGLCIM
jgi:hypothetical protein